MKEFGIYMAFLALFVVLMALLVYAVENGWLGG
jgi:hypothetical protein